MSLVQSLMHAPLVQALMPVVLIVFSGIIALLPLAVHVVLHPFIYIVSTESLSKRAKLVQQKFFYFVWRWMSPLFDPGEAHIKAPLLKRAQGVVLEIGPGVGDNIKYYTRSKVSRLILVEPNASMHKQLREKANAAGYEESDGTLLLLGCGGAVTDETPLSLAGVGSESVDTVVSVHVLCGIPGPAQAIEMYKRLLKSGTGLLLFFEHVKSSNRFAADWQEWYTRWIWPYAFDGCCMDRQTGALIAGGPNSIDKRPLSNGLDMVNGIGGWEEAVGRRWKEFHIDQPEATLQYSCLPNVMGWAVKA